MTRPASAPDGAGAEGRRRAGFVRRRPLAAVAVTYLAMVVAATLAAPVLAPYGADDQDLGAAFSPPTAEHWLGTGALGRDVLSRLLLGGQVTLSGVAISVVVFVLVGVPAGVAAGYLGSWFDWVLSRTWEVVVAVPAVIVLLVVLAVHPNDETLAMIALGLLASPGLARVVRSATMDRRDALYVRAAQSAGLSSLAIMRRHVVPGIIGPTIVQVSLFASAAVMLETALGFLGLGVQRATWGTLVAEASANLGQQPWLLVPSGFVIISFVLSLGLIGDAARDAWAARMTGGSPLPRVPTRRHADPARGVVPDEPVLAGGDDSDVLLRVRDLTIAYPDRGGEVVVVDGVSFDVAAGEAVGLVGESGCGKTALATAIMGLVRGGGRVVSGSIRFGDDELVGADEATLRSFRGGRMGWISQDPVSSLDPRFTIGSQVAEVVSTHSDLSRADAWAHAVRLLGRVRLPNPADLARAYPHELSGGMAQRVGIACAIAAEPQLLIADEPTTALDVTVQAEILDLLRELQADGMAVILVTHDWGVLAELCDRALVMYAGQLVEAAAVDDLVASPAHPYTAALVAANPSLARRGLPLPTIAGTVPPPAEWPTGCRFAARCPHAVDACAVPVSLTVPDVEPPGRRRSTRCILPESFTGSGPRREEVPA
ncbi:MAG: dipeptide/oligopeptide/nickel ABC transporter permease/ATP-binding protein [Aeromicrobium sp.]